jgi:DNA-binding transcriptional regulator YdaS (Cro superfamily)
LTANDKSRKVAFMKELDSLLRAVELAGGQSALARECTKHAIRKVTQQDVWSWIHRSKRVAADCAIPVEMAVGVPRQALRPDLYPDQA